ncbi:helix-turn-helix domain-containing protein [Pseudomaricurvus alkylphenolicus]|uniref:helix-turn-helix domain-containing protein n=1 Tax=Pseudomaricurvus alkylphenolicus TaxID=1306991 RepID=UPI00141E72E0|nr:helix-turn-helix domain-containing protein [Pseudomaricurvus alkylphenolicus]NIB43432.1 helix-turn-helix domain-containing protein [Pseudomaricurvus alkylphenolicus]
MKTVVNDADAVAQFNVAGAPFALILKRCFHSKQFPQEREALLKKWSSRFERKQGISSSEAKQFLGDSTAYLDHSQLFDYSIVAGKTHARVEDPASDFPVSYHSNRSGWTLHLTLQGGVVYNAGTPIEAQRGDLVLITPDASVNYQRDPSQREWLHYWTIFQPQPGWQELMQWQLAAYGLYKLALPSDAEIVEFEHVFSQFLKIGGNSAELLDKLRFNLLEQLLIRARQSMGSSSTNHTDPRILEASRFMKETLSERRSVAEIAAVCNVSESRLAHLFQQHLNMGVQQYRNSLRLQLAKRLLATTVEPIADVANQVGYSNPAEFSRFFSRNIGCSPRQFRITFANS